ncbi:hypothetical protein BpHYR1_001545 [Brachionus plicatilis]|uniref:Uncharacterized protein n=1 Tax=Brachionus plicatilis TaxID=10195 RepID=A0A3M7Q020_BRAPC|nr:hypothetical protein BpHYR1_001545 [Brachionus plicatilis]
MNNCHLDCLLNRTFPNHQVTVLSSFLSRKNNSQSATQLRLDFNGAIPKNSETCQNFYSAPNFPPIPPFLPLTLLDNNHTLSSYQGLFAFVHQLFSRANSIFFRSINSLLNSMLIHCSTSIVWSLQAGQSIFPDLSFRFWYNVVWSQSSFTSSKSINCFMPNDQKKIKFKYLTLSNQA